MGEFRIHHYLSELIELLGLDSSYAEQSIESIANAMKLHPSSEGLSSFDIENLAREAPDPSAFLKKYEELRSRNVAELNSMITCLKVLKEDAYTLTSLQNFSDAKLSEDSYLNVPSPNSTIQNIFSEFDDDDDAQVKLSSRRIDELKARLLEGAQKSQVGSSEAMNHILKNEKKKIMSVPQVPEWIFEKPHLSLNFVIPDHHEEGLGPLGDVGVTTQEHQLLEDILHLMVGCRGTYIQTIKAATPFSAPTFTVDSSVETSLRSLVKRVLPLIQHYSQVVSFVEEFSKYKHGLVNHALVAAIRNLLKDYMLLVTQLETQQRKGTLTLHRLWFYVEKTRTMMEMIACLTSSIAKSDCHGGGVLSLLHERTLSLTGCGQLQEVMTYLAQAASVPFMKTLRLWISIGIINDPYLEFMVVDNEDFDQTTNSSFNENRISDDYWSKRYSLQDANIPTFLQPHADMILRTGKYLNVIRDSGISISCPEQTELSYSVQSTQYTETIEKTYNFASKRLLDLMMDEKDLMGRLKSIKHFFLLDQGDFVAQLLTLCEGELSKNIDDVLPTRLVSLLELALRTSTATAHIYKDDVQCTLTPYSLINQMMQILSIETDDEREFKNQPERLHMTGLQGFSLTYKVQWPVSLIIDKKSLFSYQLIFRHLFYCKHVERLLCRVWISNKVIKAQNTESSSAYSAAFSLRQRMLLFLQNLQYYMHFEVIEINWQNFIVQIPKVENIDEVLICHTEFLNACLEDCMLTTPELLRIVTKLTAVCVDFANFIICMRKFCLEAESEGDYEDEEDAEKNPEAVIVDASESFDQTVAKFDLKFTALLVTLLDKITEMGRENYSDALTHLIDRLDFNNYYAKKGEAMQIPSSPENSLDVLLN